jgi:hypothetical protein
MVGSVSDMRTYRELALNAITLETNQTAVALYDLFCV